MRRFPKVALVPRSATRTAAGALAALSLAAAGCLMQASYSVSVTTADGVTMEVPLSQKFEINAGDDAVAVRNFRFVPLVKDTSKAMGYSFELEFKGNNRPASIAVDDVSEAPIMSILTDNAPKLAGKDRWVSFSPPYNPADEHINWIMTLDNGVRVYRFTVKLTDGTTHVLRVPIMVPSMSKAVFRSELGVK